MVARMVTDLQATLSQARLGAYRQPGGTDLDMVVNYLWNIDLAEAILPSLHAFEIALRNAIHNAMTIAHNTDFWFFKPGLLEPAQLRDFVNAYDKVYKKPAPISDRIVAQLMFGFWTAMLNDPYDQKIWRDNGYATLYSVFPYAKQSSGSNISRKDIHNRLKLINDFRNRVFHYEKIYTWNHNRGNPKVINTRAANQDHTDIHEAIKWISPTLHQAIHAVDSFPQAFTSRAQVEVDLKARLGIP